MSFTARIRLIAIVAGLAASSISSLAASQQIQRQAPRRELGGVSASLVITGGRRFGDGYRLFDRDGGEQGIAGELTVDVLSLGGSGRLALGLGIQGESYQSSTPGVVELQTWGPYATAIARFRSTATWQPYVGLAAGAERGDLALTPPGISPEKAVKSRDWGAFGRACLGVRFAPRWLIARSHNGHQLFGGALALELAGTAGTSLKFGYHVQPPSQGAGDSDRIPTGSVPLGSVSRRALQGRALISALF